MNYVWLETFLMGTIFLAASLFAVKHFAPGFYASVLRLLKHKDNRAIAINLVATTNAGSCQTKCSACNGCSMASK